MPHAPKKIALANNSFASAIFYNLSICFSIFILKINKF